MVDREKLIAIIKTTMASIGVIGTLLAVIAHDEPWLVTVCTILLILFTILLIIVVIYYSVPFGISWQKIRKGIAILMARLNEHGFTPDLILGAGRSGSLVGSLLAGNLGHSKFIAIDVRYDKRLGVVRAIPNGPISLIARDINTMKVLVTFADVTTGETLYAVKEYLRQNRIDVSKISYATLFLKPDSPARRNNPDIYFAFDQSVSGKRWKATPWYISDDYNYEGSSNPNLIGEQPELRALTKLVIVDSIKSNKQSVILIGGAGCVGKSSFAIELRDYLANTLNKSVSVLDLDCYLIEREQRETENQVISGYNPAAYFLDVAVRDIESLLTNRPIHVSPYDKHKSKKGEKVTITPADIILIEGVMALSDPIRPIGSLSLYMYAENEVLYENRKLREQSLGFDAERIEQKFKLLCNDYERFIVQHQFHAEIIVKIGHEYEFLSVEMKNVEKNFQLWLT